MKHFAANNSEYDRHNLNAIVDERTLREIYLPAFEASVREAHVGAVMDSYNLLNGERLTASDRMNNSILKSGWGFDGIVMSDWGATASTLPSATGGLDLEMPNGRYMNPAALKADLASGKLSMQAIDDKVRRILRVAVRFGFLDRPQWDPGLSEFDTGGDEISYKAALASITLLKNDAGGASAFLRRYQDHCRDWPRRRPTRDRWRRQFHGHTYAVHIAHAGVEREVRR